MKKEDMEPYELEAIGNVTQRPARDYRTLRVTGITPVIGAEVTGLDLSEELSHEQFAELHTAFLDHHVLVVRDQTLTREQHRRIAGRFGELRPVNPPPPHGDPYILEIATRPEAANVSGNGWHADGTADAEPSLGSMLYLTRVPETGHGGDTMFANMYLAYEMLSPALRELLGGLTAIHDGAQAIGSYKLPPDYEVPKSEHPLVVRHPETGRRLLYVNKAYTSRIPQLSAEESRALLDLLFQVIAQRPLLHCRVAWEPNTLVFWDNRCVQHHAIYDYYPYTRYGERVAINGGPVKG